MRKFLLVTLMLLITSLAYGEGIKWYENFDGGLAEAKRTGKPIMIDFYTDWCHWCDELDKKVYTNSDVIKLAED
ncbi:thioredoxin family protein, partial [bacterium]|nr:thioredoxin family protein [bacterium]MCG2675651.1 thioredoxin family protein [bacterium]